MKYDFSGYATKNGLKCADGRTIMPNAFKEADGQTVPLVWQHLHNEPTNILGHAILENREDGVYTYGVFNETAAGLNAKQLVEHEDIKALSIYANNLKQKGQAVLHGAIREVSLVLSGANPGALIDFLSFQHGDDYETSDDEAIIYTGLELMHSENGGSKEEIKEETEELKHEEPKSEVLEPEVLEHADEDDETLQDVFDTLNEKQKTVVYAMLAHVSEMGGKEEEEEPPIDEDVKHSDDNKGELSMKKNVFDNIEDKATAPKRTYLTHDQLNEIVSDAKKLGSFKESFLAHTVTYGIENIDYLFPDARTLTNSPDFVSRRMDWVTKVLDGASHSPFSRIKSMSADITIDDARAKGYIKGHLKREEFFALSRRTTTPTTIYKKQKLDRDDIIDINDLDVVAWLKAEMRIMLDEEIARAALLGDGRPVDIAGSANEDKVDEACIRPIAIDSDFYAHRIEVTPNTSGSALVDAILRERTHYKGTGKPTFFMNDGLITDLLLIKDKMGRRLYNTELELAQALRVSEIVSVEVMENYNVDGMYLLGIMVNMSDYTFGADKGGQVSMFDDFDIDYNQYKYLIEGRCCGCLTKPKSALVFWRGVGTSVTPTAPTFVQGTNTITIPTKTGVIYSLDGVVKSAGAYVIVEDAVVTADPDTRYFFPSNITVEWDFPYVDAG